MTKRTDFSRLPAAKDRAVTRRAARRIKSARVFLAIAFPPADAFAPAGR